MNAPKSCSADCRTVIAPANVLLVTSIYTILAGIVLVICLGLTSGRHTSHISISNVGIPISLCGCVTLAVAAARIMHANKELSIFTSFNVQEGACNSFSSSACTFSNKFDSPSLNNADGEEFPKQLTNHQHQRLPVPLRRAVLN
ncbi:unnamed protein product [Trichobilharzia regenti]|nr:unnamed protein product [Trichobilharzia regenti]